jgi:hypothetical protein
MLCVPALLVDPGFAGEPGVLGAADRATGAREKHRAALKAIVVGLNAGRDRSPRQWAFDHDHTHVSLPYVSFCCFLFEEGKPRPVGSRLLLVRTVWVGGITHLPVVYGAWACSEGEGVFQPAGFPPDGILDVN